MRRPGRARCSRIGILALWIVGLGVLVQRELFRPHAEQLTEAGLRVTPSATFFAVLQRGQQIGFASSTVDTADGGIAHDDYLVADLPDRRAGCTARARGSSVRLTPRAAAPMLHARGGRGPRRRSRRRARCSATPCSSLTVNGVAGQPADTQRVRLTGPILLAHARADSPSPSASARRSGASYTLPIFDPATMTPRDVAVEGGGREPVRAPGQQRVRSIDAALEWRAAGHRARVEAVVGAGERRHRGARASTAGWTSRGAWCCSSSCSASRSSGGRTRWRSRTGRPTRGARGAQVTADEDIYETTAISREQAARRAALAS